MWLTDLFRPSLVVRQPKVCLGCAARIAHIEDLQALLKSEREGNSALQTLLFTRGGLIAPPQPEVVAEQKPLRNILTTAQLRKMAEDKEAKDNPEAKKQYWARVQDEYDKAGKLPEGV